ncbi:MAG: antibiotic biosynthesis monooxygenase [Acidobacteria bacterium]|nr:antibiotic biosynthesis monooxygenase [Acidobacteriota bacterium]
MYVVCVTLRVEPGFEERFIEATRENHLATRQEPGNLRFDVLRATEEPCRFFLYEAYRTPEDFTRHQQTPHYLAWRDAVAGWMACKREGVRHVSLFPDESGW